jgi:hypothetical protein
MCMLGCVLTLVASTSKRIQLGIAQTIRRDASHSWCTAMQRQSVERRGVQPCYKRLLGLSDSFFLFCLSDRLCSVDSLSAKSVALELARRGVALQTFSSGGRRWWWTCHRG